MHPTTRNFRSLYNNFFMLRILMYMCYTPIQFLSYQLAGLVLLACILQAEWKTMRILISWLQG